MEEFQYFSNLGLAGAVLAYIGWVIKHAIFDSENGLLTSYRRNADSNRDLVSHLQARERQQQALCEAHVTKIEDLAESLENHLRISEAIVSAIEQLRNQLEEN